MDQENHERLCTLTGREYTYAAIDDIQLGARSKGEQGQQFLLKAIGHRAPDIVRLRLGAQVVLLRNMPQDNLVNGSRGVVVGFRFEGSKCNVIYPCVLFDSGITKTVVPVTFFRGFGQDAMGSVRRRQLPLKLAWALTVHKSQGMSLTSCELMVENAFEHGQVYVALSRCVSSSGLWISGSPLSKEVVKAHPDVVNFYVSDERKDGENDLTQTPRCA